MIDSLKTYPIIKSGWNFWAGVILALGTTGFAPVIVYGLLALQAFRGFNTFRVNIPTLLLAVIIGSTAPFTTDWLRPLLWAASVILIGSLWRHIVLDRRFMAGVFLVMLAHFATAAVQFYTGMDRPQGLNTSASWLGMAGFAAFQLGPVPGLAGSLIVGISGSRTYMASVAIMGLWWLWKRDRLRVGIALLAGLVFLVTIQHTGDWDRMGFADNSCDSGWSCSEGVSIVRSWNNRNSLNNPENMKPAIEPTATTVAKPTATTVAKPTVEPTATPKPSVKAVETVVDNKPLAPAILDHLASRPFGFGYRDYYHETKRPVPHNQIVLILWELGWLALPFSGVLGYGAWRYRRQWPYLVALIPGILLTTEYYGKLEGVYAITLIMLGISQNWPVRASVWDKLYSWWKRE